MEAVKGSKDKEKREREEGVDGRQGEGIGRKSRGGGWKASAAPYETAAQCRMRFRHTLLAGSLSRPPRSRFSLSPPDPLIGLSPSFLSPSLLSEFLRLSLFLSPTADFSPVTDPEVEPLEIFFPVLVPLLGPLLLIFLSGDGGAESLHPTGRLIRAIPV